MAELTDFILDKSSDIQFILISHHPYMINNIPWDNWQIVNLLDSSESPIDYCAQKHNERIPI
ncbi:hypothetical protein PN451_07880 [Dolichospermum planctonicum CS-1226]|uniref:ATPase AAA-type core domain-containing protein n=2 Tax=Dolichospermum planctonicum TaxID=136072 RepID=A0ABT5AFL0_9CYAN|nr:hypothetical protein [Dolichospermum planctonicum]MDB9535757.1 hypothetical protein [Dolichospermum planctonicum CS-1226]